MTNYDNTNKGALFKNDRRENDRQPEYTGSLNVGGQEYWLSAWVKDGKKGRFFSLAIKPKEEQRTSDDFGKSPRKADPISTGRPRQNDFDDGVPFEMEWR